MLTADDNIKLADFGLAAHSNSNKRKTLCGTDPYMPPGMLNGQSYNNFVILPTRGGIGNAYKKKRSQIRAQMREEIDPLKANIKRRQIAKRERAIAATADARNNTEHRTRSKASRNVCIREMRPGGHAPLGTVITVSMVK